MSRKMTKDDRPIEERRRARIVAEMARRQFVDEDPCAARHERAAPA